jgi:hypothetical protein
VFLVVGVVFAVLLFVLSRGGPEAGTGPSPEPRPLAHRSGGVLVYSVPDGHGNARLWLWDLATDQVRKGPRVAEPSAIVNVETPAYGWLGITSDLGPGVEEASLLDSLEPGARPESLGRGDLVTWAGQGDSVVLVDRGPLLDGCRREITVTPVGVETGRRPPILHAERCIDVLSAGRTTIGFFLTIDGPTGIDVVGAGYPDAGLLLRDHGVIAISPSGSMLVTPSAQFVPAVVATRPGNGEFDPPPIPVAGAASLFSQFRGRPVPYLVNGIALRIDRVLAWAPDGGRALVVARLGSEGPGLWSVPLVVSGAPSLSATYLVRVRGFTAAAFASDGTPFVFTDGRLWELGTDAMSPLRVPLGAPPPGGPIAWIVREPLAGL